MKKIILLTGVLLLAFISFPLATNAQTKPSANASDEEKLRYFKKVLWQKAYWNQDTKLLDRLLSDKFQFVRNDGTISTKRDEMEYIRKNKPSYDSFVYTIKRLDIFENDTAIIAGDGRVKGKSDTGEYEYTYSSSNVLIKEYGVWKAVASHVSGYKRTETSRTK